MKCQAESSQMQSVGISLGEMQEVQGQEAHHSTQSLQPEVQNSPSTCRKFGKKIKWPQIKEDIREMTSKGSVDKRLITAKIIVSYAAECSGYEEKKGFDWQGKPKRERLKS